MSFIMGTVVGTLHYDIPSTIPVHNKIRNYLTRAAEKEGLNPNSLYEKYTLDPNVESFGVDLSGSNIWWIGKETAKQQIDDFLIKMCDYLRKQGLQNVKISQAL